MNQNHMSDGYVHERNKTKHEKKCEVKHESKDKAERENKNEAENMKTHYDMRF
jgi:hypothetical protein